eukprot:COSAG06_NODE_9245_length_1947_cov_0.898864_3_plen_114_part_01
MRACCRGGVPSPVSPIPAPLAVPFKLGQVTLAEGSLFEQKQAANSEWLLALIPSNLTCLYTSSAKLTCSTTGVPYKCQPTAAMPVRSETIPILSPIFFNDPATTESSELEQFAA